jgi:hypothetical protein
MSYHEPHRIIRIRVAAPPKPAWGAPCNGCGVCCLAEPCPVGILASRRRHGACDAVIWMPEERRYRCGMVLQPAKYLPAWLRVIPLGWRYWLPRLTLHFIAAGRGCDSDATVE